MVVSVQQGDQTWTGNTSQVFAVAGTGNRYIDGGCTGKLVWLVKSRGLSPIAHFAHLFHCPTSPPPSHLPHFTYYPPSPSLPNELTLDRWPVAFSFGFRAT